MKRHPPPSNSKESAYAKAAYYAKVDYWYKTEWVALLVRARMAGYKSHVVAWDCLDKWGAWNERFVVMNAVERAERATNKV